jgi:hypothetical protein
MERRRLVAASLHPRRRFSFIGKEEEEIGKGLDKLVDLAVFNFFFKSSEEIGAKRRRTNSIGPSSDANTGTTYW